MRELARSRGGSPAQAWSATLRDAMDVTQTASDRTQQTSSVLLSHRPRRITPPHEFFLRRRQDEDIGPLCDLLRRAEGQGGGLMPDPLSSIEDIAALLTEGAPDRFEIVATVGGRVVGLAGLYPLGGAQRHVGNLLLYVDDAFQGRGIGSALMRRLLLTAQVMIGLRRVQLAVFTDNRRAISLYERFGFSIEGRLACFAQRAGGLADAYLMAHIQPPA